MVFLAAGNGWGPSWSVRLRGSESRVLVPASWPPSDVTLIFLNAGRTEWKYHDHAAVLKQTGGPGQGLMHQLHQGLVFRCVSRCEVGFCSQGRFLCQTIASAVVDVWNRKMAVRSPILLYSNYIHNRATQQQRVSCDAFPGCRLGRWVSRSSQVVSRQLDNWLQNTGSCRPMFLIRAVHRALGLIAALLETLLAQSLEPIKSLFLRSALQDLAG